MNYKGNDPWLRATRDQYLRQGVLTNEQWGRVGALYNDLTAVRPELFGKHASGSTPDVNYAERIGLTDLAAAPTVVPTTADDHEQQEAPTWLRTHLEEMANTGQPMDEMQRCMLWELRSGRDVTHVEAGYGSLMKSGTYRGPGPSWSPHPDHLAYLASLPSAEPPHSEPSGPTTAQPQSDPHSDCAALVRRLTEAHPRPARCETHSALRQARDAGVLDEYLTYICWRWDHDGVVSHVEAGHAIAWSNGEYHGPRSNTWVRPPAFLEWLERQPCGADR